MDSFRGLYEELRAKIQDFGYVRDARKIRSQYDEVYRVRLRERVSVQGPVEQGGNDGRVLTVGTFESPTALFQRTDVGKILTLFGSIAYANNNRAFKIVGVVNSTTVVTDPPTEGPDPVTGLDLKWALRDDEGSGDGTEIYRVEQGDISPFVPEFLLTDGNSDHVITARRHFRTGTTLSEVERTGTDGAVDANGRFFVPRSVFSRQDLDKPLYIKGLGDEDGKYLINRVVDDKTISLRTLGGDLVSLGAHFTADLEWVLLTFPEIELETPRRLDGVVLQGGVDAEITAPSTIFSASAGFAADDVGRLIRVANSAHDQDDFYVIASVPNASTVTVEGAPFTVNETEIVWNVREPTENDRPEEVEVRAPSLLKIMAQDFGLTLDLQESERRQRSWVHGMTRWVDKKGSRESYVSIGIVSGFDVEPSQLFKLSDVPDTGVFPADQLYEIGVGRDGTYGLDGSTFASDRFYSPTAVFKGADEGRFVRLKDSAANDGLFKITEVVDANNVRLNAVLSTDALNGGLTWGVVEIFTDLPPRIPRFDDIKGDLLTHIVDNESGGALVFGIDRFCWGSDWSSDVPVVVTAVPSSIDYTRYSVSVQSATSGVAATGSITTVAVASLSDGEGFILRDGHINPVRFAFDVSGAYTPPAGTVEVDVSALVSADDVRDAIISAVNGSSLNLTASDGGAATVTLTHDFEGIEGNVLLSENVFDVGFVITNLSGGLGSFTAPSVVAAVGYWKLIDSSGSEFMLETVPVDSGSGTPPIYTFEVQAVTPNLPAVGAATLRYECPTIIGKGYCPASVVRLEVRYGSITEDTGVALERAVERLLTRVRTEVKPAHVRLVPVIGTEITASLNITATVDSGVVGGAEIVAPLTAYFDIIPGDVIPADTAIVVVVDTPD